MVDCLGGLLLFWGVIFTYNRMSDECNISVQLRAGRWGGGRMYQRRPVCGMDTCGLSSIHTLQCADVARGPVSSTCTLTLCNTRSVRHKTLQLYEMLQEQEIDLAGLTETWLGNTQSHHLGGLQHSCWWGYLAQNCIASLSILSLLWLAWPRKEGIPWT